MQKSGEKRNKMKKIYLDYNATTPILPEIYEAIKPYIIEKWGNPSSSHWAGKGLKDDIQNARETIAKSLNCSKDEIYFTSCGTESNNWVLKSVCGYNLKNKHIITTKVEHKAILETLKFLEKNGLEVTYLDVDKNGLIDLNLLENSIKENTILISVIFANNETGIISPIEEIGKIAKKYNILFHTDAVQAYGKIKIDLQKINIDFLSISGHKVYSPKGIGVLYIKDGINLEPFIHGGGQEKGLRSGTENVIGIIALGKSAEIIIQDFESGYYEKLKNLKDKLENSLKEIEDILIAGENVPRVPNTINISFKNIEAQALKNALNYEGIAVSSGSACASEKESISHVLQAMGYDKMTALGTIRISIGKYTTEEDIFYTADKIKFWVNKLRSFLPNG